MGWGHLVRWVTFTLTTPGSVHINDIPFVSSGTVNPNYNPAFTLYATTGYSDPALTNGEGHAFDQTGLANTLSASSWAVTTGADCSGLSGGSNPCAAGNFIYGTGWLTDPNEGGVTRFVGYANSGATGWHNSTGALIGTGGVGAGYSGSTAGTVSATLGTGGGIADLIIDSLPAGQYLLAVGGSYACNGGLNFSDATNACPSVQVPAGTANGYKLTITTAPVPVPAAVWLFGSALAGLGLISRRCRPS